ncbi:uncharacterized protein BXZ73DRAFT_41071 [Epithele typhae]|uniref:uncharacterized protein n=1 Tax=Epithele typhae TaxID=378194 RepID=UPI002008A089|nr:uncharacterized protein BXZ73DRAFT_41071 [Epithele typhae]KAH9942136.1 hypothetical protein BXZ73DRAFT_41071 [Epithele typhae]
MWLLSTATAELKFFNDPEAIPGGYAILSHVWLSEGEDTFQAPSTPTTVSEAKTTDSDDPRDLISPKVCAFLKLAQRDGYEWAWSDTCCIDKASSAELTEAINSMFRYYQLSDVCYVYLADVPPGPFGKLFAQSRWHTRGWTLQELIAPKTVLFMAADWTLIGSKYELADELERVAKVPVEVLRFDKDVAEVSVAARMSWAARRKTTRVEDEAYCLFGLFGINMPTLYGEGQNAFYRLQQEIMRTSIDTSLVAWGTVTPVSSVEELLRRARMAAGHLQGYEFLLAPRVECYRYHAYTEFDESRRFLCAQEVSRFFALTQSICILTSIGTLLHSVKTDLAKSRLSKQSPPMAFYACFP